MLRIALLELRAKKGWTKRFVAFLAILSVVAVVVAVYSVLTGIKIDYGIYSANIAIEDPKFVKSENPDIAVYNGVVIVKGDLKSLSAYDEFRNYVRKIYNEWVSERYGSSAFPILIRIVRIPTKVEFVGITAEKLRKVVEIAKKERKEIPGVAKREEEKRGIGSVLIKKEREKEGERAHTKAKSKFLTPDELRPPSLLGKLIYAFSFVIPIYFVIQVYSSSAIEDKIKRRFELLFVAEDEWKVIVGKMLPYIALSVILACAITIALGKSLIGIVFLIPIILFLVALSTFTAMISRSYKEMTFLTIIISIFITTYLFIPAIFTAIPMSKISPITLLLKFFEGEEINAKDYFISTFQFYLMSLILIYLSLNSLEVMHSQSNPIEKIVEISIGVVNRYPLVFLASLLSIPFVFVIEFFTLSIIFAIEYAFAIVILLIAVIEEFFKGLFIYSAIKNGLNPYVSAFLSALGFLIGEKAILFSFIPIKFVELIPAPLMAHLIASLIFVATMRFGFRKALLASSAFHAVYDGVILWGILR